MLQARSVAVVGASERPDSFGWRMTTEVLRSPGLDQVHLVNPARDTVLGHPCVPSLADVPDPVDLVLLGVPDKALVDQVRLASARGDAGAVVFGPAHGQRDERGRRRRRAGGVRRRVHGLRERPSPAYARSATWSASRCRRARSHS